ncbi:MAG: cardiolipin synthase [Ruminococcaceae bacterium]|nr:cardiolipin synthase [Oscillospiraceae bacterium]
MKEYKKRYRLWSWIRKLLKLMFSRVVIIAFLLLIEILVLLAAVIYFSNYFYIFVYLSTLLNLLCVCKIIRTDDNPGYKITWTIVVLMFPPVGIALYFAFSRNRLSQRTLKKMSSIAVISEQMMDDNADIIADLREKDRGAARQSAYISNMAMCPPYKNTETVYHPTGESFFEALLQAVESAERYIFLEYFIIAEGEMWGRLHALLKEKARAGVDVRVIYDDFGSITRLNYRVPKILRSEGIKCHVFHPFVPVLDASQNNRDHRKICVVDGYIAFTGGINIGDEYINVTHPHGHWKDNAIELHGEGAWSFVLRFLTMWEYLEYGVSVSKKELSFDQYKPDPILRYSEEGIVQPYTDTPLDNEPVGENIYLQLLYGASDYVWITTPYLIIDEQMKQALCTAAKSGIDVRIMVPGIPDKKTIYETTKSYYKALLESGVKIYEYTPGFLHAKTFLCDDKYATVGSVNLDFRSLYLHFECGVWMYGTSSVKEIKNDYIRTMECCRQISIKDCKTGLLRELYRSILQILAPML